VGGVTRRLVSLKRRGGGLDAPTAQLEVLNNGSSALTILPKFQDMVRRSGHAELRPAELSILQVNVGKMCNQVCRHCHVDAGPDRKEIMTRATMEECVRVVRDNRIGTVDLTGGAPELNPDFRWFVEALRDVGATVWVRTNLTIVKSNPRFYDLPHFFRQHKVVVVCSLPYYERGFTDRQRGDGVFETSIEVLRELNGVGYGIDGTGLILNVVYNPCGAFLPAAQSALESEFRRELLSRFGIRFSNLFALTNLPISRFLEFLEDSGNLEDYMEKLVRSFNPVAVDAVMCRSTLSVGWDGQLYDCDFNQMLELPVHCETSRSIDRFTIAELANRTIAVNQHCYGCTAGAGSSCGGALIES